MSVCVFICYYETGYNVTSTGSVLLSIDIILQKSFAKDRMHERDRDRLPYVFPKRQTPAINMTKHAFVADSFKPFLCYPLLYKIYASVLFMPCSINLKTAGHHNHDHLKAFVSWLNKLLCFMLAPVKLHKQCVLMLS